MCRSSCRAKRNLQNQVNCPLNAFISESAFHGIFIFPFCDVCLTFTSFVERVVMDAYVIRTKRENSNKSKKLEKKKYLKQVKIEALPVCILKFFYQIFIHTICLS